MATSNEFQTLLDKASKNQAEAMLCQAIVALSVQPEFEKMVPWEVFEHLRKTCQRWTDEG